MNPESLKQHLVNNTTWLYGVFDGASVPLLPKRLFESRSLNHCLFAGDLEPDLLYAAPYIVQLVPDNPFTQFVFSEGFGKHWGIFVHSRHSINEMRRHFSSLVNVYDERARSLIFRFYDPRVLRRYLPTCTPEELEKFFGKVGSFFAESEDGKNLLSFTLNQNSLKQTELS